MNLKVYLFGTPFSNPIQRYYYIGYYQFCGWEFKSRFKMYTYGNNGMGILSIPMYLENLTNLGYFQNNNRTIEALWNYL